MINKRFDDELKPSQKIELTQHLRACPKCRREEHVLSHIVRLVETMERKQPRTDLWENIYRGISQPERPVWSPVYFHDRRWNAQRLVFGRWPGAVVAMAALAVVLGYHAFWPHSIASLTTLSPQMLPAHIQTVSDPYLSQAEEPALFDPLSDRAASATILQISTLSIPSRGGGSMPVISAVGSGGQ